jgi:hypothetical protein
VCVCVWAGGGGRVGVGVCGWVGVGVCGCVGVCVIQIFLASMPKSLNLERFDLELPLN